MDEYGGKPALVVGKKAEELLGILTAFDLL
jgi:hypothetical protein